MGDGGNKTCGREAMWRLNEGYVEGIWSEDMVLVY